ncbi:1-acyl-sn-glycerol-3-phosphate acyltransferase [Lampropedia puyangensis]|uniref:1-acyl-sn-glycerol-3-phosphate acyltransferase n=1 Tax=Lampropedia puyangensis TaxID=1330072 RepID=A0A4S8FAR0_9BURK|nr:lysophospholipid acyltransferase family protein [Lampropedia puyangensis]THU04633.1 1-acyl-sn-glycerol-3-phosphate acyltransferase [Lampropedia puyangensis]
MAGVRSWLHLLVMGSTMVFYATSLMIAALFVRGEPVYRIGVAWLSVCVSSAKWMLGIRYRVQGMEHLPAHTREQKVVVLAKHQSTYETFLMPLILRHVVLSYVFKKELLSIPFFGWGIGRMDMVHIDRKQGSKAFHKVLEQGRKLTDMGNWVMMFPEGTRVPRGEVGNYKVSGSRLAIDTGAVVVPVAVASARCWAPKAIVKFPGVIDVSIGKPISTEGKTPNELMDEVQQWIEQEMHRLDPEAYELTPASQPSGTTAAAPRQDSQD